MTSTQFEKYMNNELLKYNPQLKFIKSTAQRTIRQAIRYKERAFINFWTLGFKYPQYIKKKDRIKQGVHLEQGSIHYKWRIENNKIRLPIYGWVKMKETDYILPTDNIKSCVIKMHGHRFYLSANLNIEPVANVTYLEQDNKLNHNSTILGIDVGINKYAVLSNGQQFIFPKQAFKKIEKKITRYSRKANRSYLQNKDNPDWQRKNLTKINLYNRMLYWYKTRIIEGFMQDVINTICKSQTDGICIENLNVKGMIKNKHLAKHIHERGFYKFKKKLIHKCSKLNIPVYMAHTFFPSSKRCSECGLVNHELKLKDRTFKCSCGLEIDRDLNASLNLARVTVG